jgi:hypothetical protein
MASTYQSRPNGSAGSIWRARRGISRSSRARRARLASCSRNCEPDGSEFGVVRRDRRRRFRRLEVGVTSPPGCSPHGCYCGILSASYHGLNQSRSPLVTGRPGDRGRLDFRFPKYAQVIRKPNLTRHQPASSAARSSEREMGSLDRFHLWNMGTRVESTSQK